MSRARTRPTVLQADTTLLDYGEGCIVHHSKGGLAMTMSALCQKRTLLHHSAQDPSGGF
jgi:hypothetical protein